MTRWHAVVLVVALAAIGGCVTHHPRAIAEGTPVKASAVTPPAIAAEPPAAHLMLRPDAIKWQPFPPGVPGTTFAVLSGDPEKPGPFVVRIKSPAGAKIPPHWHPSDEHVTVVTGTLALGMGETFDRKALRALPAGSYAFLPHDMRHFGRSQTATVVQVHGMGPFQMFFVNPADDPRNKASRP